MAGVPTYKCTKISNLGQSLVVTDAYTVKVDYTNPGTVPPTPGSITVEIPSLTMETPADMQTLIDDRLEVLGSSIMDWSL